MKEMTTAGDPPGERRCPLGHQGILVDFVRRARRRLIANLVCEQLVLALAAGFGGAILLLLLGTQVLDWYWPVLLFAAGFLLGVVRLRGRIPSAYTAAQRVDHRLQLEDALSTAHYFLENPDKGLTPPDIREIQLRSAEKLAAELPLSQAIPWYLPRSSYATLALALVACGMIGVRYGVRHNLDLRQPIARFQFDTFRNREEIAKTRQKEQERKLDEQFQKMGLALDDEQRNQSQQMERPNDNTGSSREGEKGTEVKTQTEKRQERGTATEQGEQQEGTEGKESKDSQTAEGNEEPAGANTNQQSPQAEKPDSNQQPAQNNQQQSENSTLMDKMRNALANMLAKMKMRPPSSEGRQMASNSKGSLQNGQQQQQRSEQKGRQSEGKDGQQQQGQPSTEGKGNQESQGDQQSQGSQGQQGEQASDKPSQHDTKTGMGKSDGNKDVKLAEQMEAMGKISEIIGKRSQNLTGEMMVEVASGKQQLKTAYTNRSAAHAESGGEIHRDEVPIVLQQYVQQYFEEVRKAPLPPAKNSSRVQAPKDGTPGRAVAN